MVLWRTGTIVSFTLWFRYKLISGPVSAYKEDYSDMRIQIVEQDLMTDENDEAGGRRENTLTSL